MHKIFVYGTLKEGFPNFNANKGIRYKGIFKTVERYPFYLVGQRYVPCLLFDPGHGHQVNGEVFDVSDNELAAIDTLEKITLPDGYRRITVSVISDTTQEEILAFAYMKLPETVKNATIMEKLSGEYTKQHASLYSKP